MRVYAAILDKNGNPLTPSPHLAKFWYLVRHGKARLVCKNPLTFQLLYEIPEPVVKSVVVGIDPDNEDSAGIFIQHRDGSLEPFVTADPSMLNKSNKRRNNEPKAP